MIRVLSSWEDYGKSLEALRRDSTFHSDPLKNWDLSQIAEMVESLPKSARILDAGCSESQCSVLRFLRKKGFSRLDGIDLQISTDDRIQQFLTMLKSRELKPPFRLLKGDITSTPYTDESFDAIICLSVIEHGVDANSFLREMIRLLKRGGVLYISTDYWPEKVETDGVKPWGLDWTIFCRKEIEAIIQIAVDTGFSLKDKRIPGTVRPLVKWSGKEYTFLSLVMTKR